MFMEVRGTDHAMKNRLKLCVADDAAQVPIEIKEEVLHFDAVLVHYGQHLVGEVNINWWVNRWSRPSENRSCRAPQ